MTKKLLIEGMSCAHCVRHVEEALKEMPEVNVVRVDLEGKNAVVELTKEVSDDAFKRVIDEVGYEVVGIEVIS